MLLQAVLVVVAISTGVESVSTLGKNYWEKSAREELEANLRVKLNTGVAKNVIIFIGDGMGPTTVTAARIYRGGEESFLSWEKFPHVGALKTYCEDTTVTDSGASATSMFTGVKVNYNVIGMSGVKEADYKSEGVKLTHITSLAQAAGKSTGFVTTARVTHATPAAMYAHSASRKWECDVPENSGYKDIGLQLIEDLPGRNLNVIMGGGQYMLQHNVTPEADRVDDYCRRLDGRNLIDEWAQEKASRGLKYAVVNNTGSLMSLDTQNTDYLLGIFAKNHLKFHHERDTSEAGSPSLEQMTTAAIKVLMKNRNGFFLMVEEENTDLSNHLGTARVTLNEVLALHDAVSATMNMLEAAGIKEETLVIVTSDHSHTLTISGYAPRGSNILGIASVSSVDGVPYTTLTYAVGNKEAYHYKAVNGSVVREDPTKVNTSAWDYHHQAAVPTSRNPHGGHDVFAYASGPYAHLFCHMHEQNYVHSVMKYAARLGEFSESSFSVPVSSSMKCSPPLSLFTFLLLLIFKLFLIK